MVYGVQGLENMYILIFLQLPGKLKVSFYIGNIQIELLLPPHLPGQNIRKIMKILGNGNIFLSKVQNR